MKAILIRYGELALKGLNRPFFEEKLVRNIRRKLKDLKNVENISITKEQGRIFIENLSENDFYFAIEKLKKVFGLVGFTICEVVEKQVEAIKSAALNIALNEIQKGKKTFKVETKRADKTFELRSPELSRLIGAHILKNLADKYGLKVDVHNPDFEVNIEIRDKAYVYSSEEKGIGGMPLGTGGKAHLLLSGGIDSPVAGFMIAKRGVEIEAVHFYSFPYTGEKAKEKVIDLCRVLAQFTDRLKLYIVPFTEIQTTIYEKCNERYLTIIMRRFMMKIAERIAKKNGGLALVTGESIGQVASQTIESIICTNAAVSMPVLRPLIGMDKEEIIRIAKNIGTYDISILPYEDCCTVFVPKHPKTKPKLEEVIKEEEKLDVSSLIENAISNTEWMVIEDR
ncbi:thiamine biosynthesis/tRNA modification protein ThiI [Caldicellulosiruptor saccharolyticus DSM 8903]|uniref:Probable tRNA sulfurtransferase n=1 Tax=Caldicellulosiruptor saccharolyticus (strain ATCC 43494 / DSM 8903 / Tp8T 6331) TaxID=351627 RepID=A4XKA9_CALS8|nr:tRNA uracil 4-sulfurtransferase ThiI [Caldicellulosiruptor saccharolyticus]ABP67344.2 thiamine biosynthesis/tRNA modification protein ThiI [Caldicellulosiruptor saccharolyticus DSM 8903]